MSATFDRLVDAYDAMIDWPKRLAHEGPFYRRWFDRIGASRVVDVACGTGRHAAMFHGWGMQVEGSDLSANMIARARATFGEPDGLRFVVRGFSEPIVATEPFDAAVCVGNSLALANDRPTAQAAISAMLSALRPGGLLIVSVLNFWRLADGPCVWQKCRRATLPAGEALIVKGVHRSGSIGYVDLIVAPLADLSQWQVESAPLLAFEADELIAMTGQAGGADARVFGGFGDEPFDRSASTDLVLVAHRER